MLGGICGIAGLAFIQARRVFEFDERVRLWEESHLPDTLNTAKGTDSSKDMEKK